MPKVSPPDLDSSHCQPTVYDRAKKSLSFPTGSTHMKMAQEHSPKQIKSSPLFQFHNDDILDFWIQFPSKSSWLSSISLHLNTHVHISIHTNTLWPCSSRPHEEIEKHAAESAAQWHPKTWGFLGAQLSALQIFSYFILRIHSSGAISHANTERVNTFWLCRVEVQVF